MVCSIFCDVRKVFLIFDQFWLEERETYLFGYYIRFKLISGIKVWGMKELDYWTRIKKAILCPRRNKMYTLQTAFLGLLIGKYVQGFH